jgi:hypothetical protein
MDVARPASQHADEDEEHKARSDVVLRVGDAATGAVHAVALPSAKYVHVPILWGSNPSSLHERIQISVCLSGVRQCGGSRAA